MPHGRSTASAGRGDALESSGIALPFPKMVNPATNRPIRAGLPCRGKLHFLDSPRTVSKRNRVAHAERSPEWRTNFGIYPLRPDFLVFSGSGANPNSPEKDDLRRLTYSDVDRESTVFPPWSAGFVGPDHAIRQGRNGDPWIP